MLLEKMEATIDHFHSFTMNEFFLKDSDIRTMYLPLVPRFQKYLQGIPKESAETLGMSSSPGQLQPLMMKTS